MDCAISLGFAGAYRDPITDGYLLGIGYRMYLPELNRFAAPDDWSPFDEGGMNPYLYCDDDPMNRVDPTGHMSWTAWTGIIGGSIGIGFILGPILGSALAGAATTIEREGALAALSAAGAGARTTLRELSSHEVVSMIAGAASNLTAVGSNVTANRDELLSKILGVASIAFGAVSFIGGAAFMKRFSITRTYQQQARQNQLRTITRNVGAYLGEDITVEEFLSRFATSEPIRSVPLYNDAVTPEAFAIAGHREEIGAPSDSLAPPSYRSRVEATPERISSHQPGHRVVYTRGQNFGSDEEIHTFFGTV